MNINKYICTGRLTRDPELRDLSSGKSVCDLRVAVQGMGRGGEVGFIGVSVFGKPGEACAQFLRKGSPVAVDGRLEFSEWQTDGGEKRHDFAVVGRVEFIGAQREPGEEEDSKPPRRRREPVAA